EQRRGPTVRVDVEYLHLAVSERRVGEELLQRIEAAREVASDGRHPQEVNLDRLAGRDHEQVIADRLVALGQGVTDDRCDRGDDPRSLGPVELLAGPRALGLLPEVLNAPLLVL